MKWFKDRDIRWYIILGMGISSFTTLYSIPLFYSNFYDKLFLKGYIVLSILSIFFIFHYVDISKNYLKIRSFYIGLALGTILFSLIQEFNRISHPKVTVYELCGIFPQLLLTGIYTLFERLVEITHEKSK